MKKPLLFIALFWVGLFFITYQANAQSTQKPTIFQYLQEKEVKQISLELDFDQYRRGQQTDDYQPAKISVLHADGTVETWDIEVRPRGNMRREVCNLPPMKFRFSKKQLKKRGLHPENKIKMVNLCRNHERYEQMLLREYFAYRIYNAITEQSFRVHLVRVKYLTHGGGSAPIDESFAFFIEPPESVAERNGLVYLEEDPERAQLMSDDLSERFAFFQYMIGNTDWIYFQPHNVKFFRDTLSHLSIPVPYDFDYSGIVNAPYAIADKRLKIRDVTVRYYQGRCRTTAETQQTINLYLEKKEEVMLMACEFPYFNKRSRKKLLKYLSSFYTTIEKRKRWRKAITAHCDKWPIE
jgi:hypothetical protein